MSAVLLSVLTASFKTGFPSLSLKAQLQRGNLLLKQGRLDEAESDYKKVVSEVRPFTSEDPGLSSRWQCWTASEWGGGFATVGVCKITQRSEGILLKFWIIFTF